MPIGSRTFSGSSPYPSIDLELGTVQGFTGEVPHTYIVCLTINTGCPDHAIVFNARHSDDFRRTGSGQIRVRTDDRTLYTDYADGEYRSNTATKPNTWEYGVPFLVAITTPNARTTRPRIHSISDGGSWDHGPCVEYYSGYGRSIPGVGGYFEIGSDYSQIEADLSVVALVRGVAMSDAQVEAITSVQDIIDWYAVAGVDGYCWFLDQTAPIPDLGDAGCDEISRTAGITVGASNPMLNGVGGGTPAVTGAATVTLSASGTVVKTVAATGTGTAALSAAATTAGNRVVTGADGLALAAAATPTSKTASTVGAASLTLDAPATVGAISDKTATANTSLSLSAVGTVVKRATGTASTTLALTAAAAVAKTGDAAATSPLVLGASSAAAKSVAVDGATSIALNASGISGANDVRAVTAAAALTLGASGSVVKRGAPYGTAALVIDASGDAVKRGATLGGAPLVMSTVGAPVKTVGTVGGASLVVSTAGVPAKTVGAVGAVALTFVSVGSARVGDGSYTPDPSRTYMVEAHERILRVQAANRTLVVAPTERR